MKLRLDEYYYIISDEFDEIEDYMPQYMVEELDKFRESHTPEEAFDYLENLYSHIEIIDTQYRTNYIDLEKSYINYTAIIKIEDKYYSFDGYYENIWNKRQITNIIGVGRGINYDVVNTQGGKTKYLCSIDTSLVFGRPDICFYFKK